MRTVHIVLQSHVDPVWLWRWSAGLDMVLNTVRTACATLDRHPDLTFTRGEAWAYRAVERADPPLFERVRAHVAAGRWEVLGGWWQHPRCNGPSGWGLAKQIELGHDYFRSRFGLAPTIAYNVDSFGHAATLPAMMAEAGQTSYVMMRPGPHEMALPARVFRWRGFEGGPVVTTFRIASAYMTRPPLSLDHVRASLEALPEGVTDTMCFVGVGDHGGGVSEEMIGWLREHANAIDGARLVFSSPSRFFDAIAPRVDRLPLVTGELQPHAVGCYSVVRSIKLGVRRAEHALRRADLARAGDPAPEPGQAERLRRGWELTCFNQFHDTLGGTSIPPAYADAADQLGEATNAADEALAYGFRRRLSSLPDDPMHRVVVWNASDRPWSGTMPVDPWREYAIAGTAVSLLDEAGDPVPTQPVGDASHSMFDLRVLARFDAGPGATRVFRVVEGGRYEPDPSWVWVRADDTTLGPTERVESLSPHAGASAAPPRIVAPSDPTLRGGAALAPAWGSQAGACSGISEVGGATPEPRPTAPTVRFDPAPLLRIFAESPAPLARPRLHAIDDPTDTWSHGIDRYCETPIVTDAPGSIRPVESGPLRATAVENGTIGDDPYQIDWRVYAGEPFVEVRLWVSWRQPGRVLKWVWPLPSPATERTDGIPGGWLDRKLDGAERPVRDGVRLALADGRHLAVVCPDVFAVDATPDRLRLTLVRSPVMAHHEPSIVDPARAVYADLGEHVFTARVFLGRPVDNATLDGHAFMMQRPPLTADLTRGMPPLNGDWGPA